MLEIFNVENKTIGGHSLHKYDEELQRVRSSLLAMGALVEKQVDDAVNALAWGDTHLAERVAQQDLQVNEYESAIDELAMQIIARHQPTARDLRFLIATIKAITDLERVGDKARKIARIAIKLAEIDRPRSGYADIRALGDRVVRMLHDAVAAFAALDPEAALAVVRTDDTVDNEYEGMLRQQMTFMMEDPRTIGRVMNVIWTIRALERIGDHASNLSEYVIYAVKGKDVRHSSLDEKTVIAAS
jgi:phosphate transport system protein